MSENVMARLLERCKNWNEGLDKSVIVNDYAKILSQHFNTGVSLLSDLKNASNSPELKPILKEELEMVRAKLIIINQARKLIDGIK